MVNRITSIWQSFRLSVRGVDSSSQLAAGVALGMMIGLLPKDSILPYFLIVILLFSRANLLSAGCSASVFCWLGPLLDPVAHAIGVGVLTFAPLESTWAWLIQQPMVPWIRFDNTVVMGSFVIGLLAAYPLYRITRHFFQTYGNTAFELFRNTRVARWLIGPPNPNLTEGPA